MAEENDDRQDAETACRLPTQKKSVCEALDCDGQFLPLEESAGAMSLEYVWAYPPGIPLIVPGEVIECGLIQHMRRLLSANVILNSSRGSMPQFIYAKRL